MWLREEEFEEILARYWELEEDNRAEELASLPSLKANGFWHALTEYFRRLAHGAPGKPIPRH